MSKGYLNMNNGSVEISSDVISSYAGACALECFGVVGMAAKSVTDGVIHLLKKDSLKKGIGVVIEDNKLYLEFHIIVAYGLNIVSITQNLVENVKYKVEQFTGIPIEKITVLVEDVRVID